MVGFLSMRASFRKNAALPQRANSRKLLGARSECPKKLGKPVKHEIRRNSRALGARGEQKLYEKPASLLCRAAGALKSWRFFRR